MTIEEFRKIKHELMVILINYNKQKKKNSDNPKFNIDELENETKNKYLKLQNYLLSCNLSEIPFDEWANIYLISNDDNTLDFSQTFANIDFNIVDYFKSANYKSCNIKNLNTLNMIFDKEQFDEEVVLKNPTCFLNAEYSEEIKDKIFRKCLNIEDLLSLTSDQLNDLSSKNFLNCVDNITLKIIKILGINRVIELYNINKEDYKVIYEIINELYSNPKYAMMLSDKQLQEIAEIKELNKIKEYFYNVFRQVLLNNSNIFNVSTLPELFVIENGDLFLQNINIEEEIKQRFLQKKLSVVDVISNIDAFSKFPIIKFMDINSKYYYDFKILYDCLGEKLGIILKENRKIFDYILTGKLAKPFTDFIYKYEFLLQLDNTEFINRLKEYLPLFFMSKNKIMNHNQLLLYDESLFRLENSQKQVINILGLSNIKKFERETRYFSHVAENIDTGHEMFTEFSMLLKNVNLLTLKKEGIDFNNGELSYENFKVELAKLLNMMRKHYIFTNIHNYNWMTGEFRNNHPEIFLNINASDILKKKFYCNEITPQYIFDNKDCIEFLKDKYCVVNSNITINIPASFENDAYVVPKSLNFEKEYVDRFGNTAYLELCSKYGIFMYNFSIECSKSVLDDRRSLENLIIEVITKKILDGYFSYEELKNIPEYVNSHQDMFVDFTSISNIEANKLRRLTMLFYKRQMSFDDIRKYPELIPYLKDKNLWIGFGFKNKVESITSDRQIRTQDYDYHGKEYSDLELLSVFGPDKFLNLCKDYGRYLDGICFEIHKKYNLESGKFIHKINQNILSYEELIKEIKKYILSNCLNGRIEYSSLDIPKFVKEENPEIFLDENVPEELKKYYYGDKKLNFEILKANRDWLSYFKGKSITPALLRGTYYRNDMYLYLQLFGEEKALKFGMNRTETVEEMIKSHKVELMYNWYKKTGYKFIPDVVVMENFPVEEADKFLISGSNWSTLMRIKNFSMHKESRDAMLKLAYTFGAFDQDQIGMKKLINLLTDVPRKYSDYNFRKLIRLENKILSYINNDKSSKYAMPLGTIEYKKLRSEFENDGYIFNEGSLFKTIFNIDESGVTTLQFNPQSNSKATGYLRTLLEMQDIVLNGNLAHQLFGGFSLKYSKDFREFLLKNYDEICSKPEEIKFISSIQKQFDLIKSFNSNRILTWELAVSFVQTNKYSGINVGNEKVAEVCAIGGYTQEDFETLQKIYNSGKQRVFSGIPRIEGGNDKYSYEILRLDDPLAMAIGTLTDCCQALGNVAELCMEHSMTDKNGRSFVIRDNKGNIVAQSWIWRNKNVACFDNIEIPSKAFIRAMEGHTELGRKGFTDEIYELYKKAARELIEADETMYKNLLEQGKISQEQYDGLRLSKVTVGLGYNDIARSLKENAEKDLEDLARPLPYDPPVPLKRDLYTSDSSTQYILEDDGNNLVTNLETLQVHNDIYTIYNDSNFNFRNLIMIKKLEVVTKGGYHNLRINVNESDDLKHIVSLIAKDYFFNPELTKIVMSPNFAIIYEEDGDIVKVGDLLFNTKIDNKEQQIDIEGKVVMQIRLALEQIGLNKKLDISSLSIDAKNMYLKAMNLDEELDIERGVKSGR